MSWLRGLLLGICLLGTSPTLAQQFPVPADPQRWQQTAAYLQQLGLHRLQAEWLEARLFQQPPPAETEQQALAQELIGLYQQQLLQAAPESEPAQAPDWLARTRTLLTIYPQLETEALLLAMSQARYRQLEQAQAQWWRQGAKGAASAELAGQWRQLIEDLQRLRNQLQARYEDRLILLEGSLDTTLGQAALLDQWEQQVSRADYLLGWSHYWLGIALPPERKAALEQADRYLREYLQIDSQQVLLSLDPSWIQWQSDWDAQALIGLAMCHRGLDHPQQSQHCFDLIESHIDQGRLPEQLATWRLRSRLFVQDGEDIPVLLRQQASDREATARSQQLFWTTAWEGGLALRQRDPGLAGQLQAAALAGLARDFQGPQLRRLLQEAGRENLDDWPDAFLAGWINGYLALESLREAPADLTASERRQWQTRQRERATRELNRALAAGTVRTEDLHTLRYLLALLELESQRWSTAAEQWNSLVQPALDAGQLPLALRSQWAAVNAQAQAARRDPEAIPAVLTGLDQLATRFPGSPYQSSAAALRLEMLQLNLPPARAIEQWRQIREGDPNYAQAGYQWVVLAYQQWLADAAVDEASARRQLQPLQQAARDVLPRWPAESDRALDIQLLVAQALVQTPGVEPAELQVWLVPLTARLASRPDRDPLVARWWWVTCLDQARRGEFEQAGHSLKWLDQHAAEDSLVSSAAIAMARQLEQQRDAATPLVGAQRATALAVYAQLSGQLGSADKDLQASDNARIVAQRLAELLGEDGQTDAAADRWEQLHRLFPRRKDYVRQLAAARQAQQRWQQAGELWQQLALAESPGSERWLEARLQQITCLLGSGDRQTAGQVFRQTGLLIETVPPAWETTWQQLRQQLQLPLPGP